MIDSKVLLEQNEILKEKNARLYDEIGKQKFQVNELVVKNAELLKKIAQLESEKQQLNERIAAKDAEIRKLHQDKEVITEYNKRLYEQVKIQRQKQTQNVR